MKSRHSCAMAHKLCVPQWADGPKPEKCHRIKCRRYRRKLNQLLPTGSTNPQVPCFAKCDKNKARAFCKIVMTCRMCLRQ